MVIFVYHALVDREMDEDGKLKSLEPQNSLESLVRFHAYAPDDSVCFDNGGQFKEGG